ncbi:MAG: M48 family metalloprotease [Alphaproteobacteria bacterium]
MRPVAKSAWVVLLLLSTAGCAAPMAGAVPDLEPGERPEAVSDEAGLWMAMDRVEDQLKTSGNVVTDPALNAYVRDLVCKLAGPYCGDLRTYIMRVPHFNASMAPNGVMQVWTGLILRARNEAQLAYVLGHELGHYLRRHSLKRWRDVRAKTDALVFLQIAASAARYGYVGDLAQFIALASIFAYSRDQEREADDLGFELMLEAGYDPHEAAKVWRALIEEREAADEPERLIFFSTHPSTGERAETLESLAAEVTKDRGRGVAAEERYLAATLPFRARFMRDELRLRQFAQSQVVLDHLLDAGVNPGELHHFQGELYRLRAEEGDNDRAIEAYREAVRHEGAPPETHRDLGLVYMRAGKRGEARLSLQRYLAALPGADDRAMVESYIEQLE